MHSDRKAVKKLFIGYDALCADAAPAVMLADIFPTGYHATELAGVVPAKAS